MAEAKTPPAVRVWLAISTFRSDAALARLLEEACQLVPALFERVLVVDSLGSGAIPQLIAERGYGFVDYESASVNLGSAGNLARRLSLAAEAGADYVYALNHDGHLDEGTVAALVDEAKNDRELAVLYPLRRLLNRGGKFDVTGTLRWPVPRIAVKKPPEAHTFGVYWGSSNGTLYSLAPVRQGLTPWADLWMGFEDLGYGWLLAEKGYRQVVVKRAVFNDGYEFQQVLGGAVHRSDKPAWYSYYFARNLILVARRTHQGAAICTALGLRIAMESVVSATLRPNRAQRLRLIGKGLLDGLTGKSGFLHKPG
jgi:GT2 family glycosyltransferase